MGVWNVDCRNQKKSVLLGLRNVEMSRGKKGVEVCRYKVVLSCKEIGTLRFGWLEVAGRGWGLPNPRRTGYVRLQEYETCGCLVNTLYASYSSAIGRVQGVRGSE